MDMVQGPEFKDKTYNEIHFYESDDVFYLNQQKIKQAQENFYIGYIETKDAIYLKEPIIHTLQMACLTSYSLLFNFNYRIFIHESNGEVYEIKLGQNNERTSRELKKGHNIFKMWLSGEFKKKGGIKNV